MTEKQEKIKPQERMIENLEVSLLGSFRAISLTKDVVRLFGKPKFVCLRVNKAYDSILIKPCEREDPMSYKVPEKFLEKHNCVFRIHSKAFVRSILISNGFDPMGTYAFHSFYLPDANSIIVPIRNPKRGGEEPMGEEIHDSEEER